MKYLILVLLAPGWVMASGMSERLACMEALAKFEYAVNGVSKLQVDLIGHVYYWDGKGIFEKAVGNTEIWNAKLFREKGDGRLNKSFPSSEIDKIQAYAIKDAFNDLLAIDVNGENVLTIDSYFQSCKRIADVTVGKVPVAELAGGKIHDFRMNGAFVTVFAHEHKQEASAGK